MNTTTAAPPVRVRTTAILAIILASYFMIILDASVIFTGMYRLQAEMNSPPPACPGYRTRTP